MLTPVPCQISANAVTSVQACRCCFSQQNVFYYYYCCFVCMLLLLLNCIRSAIALSIMLLATSRSPCLQLLVPTACCYYLCRFGLMSLLLLLLRFTFRVSAATLTEFCLRCRNCCMMIVLQCLQMLPLLVLWMHAAAAPGTLDACCCCWYSGCMLLLLVLWLHAAADAGTGCMLLLMLVLWMHAAAAGTLDACCC
jgi:hypothetical protein